MNRLNKILCVVEPDKLSVSALKQGIKIAQDHQADILFVSIVKPNNAIHQFSKDKVERESVLMDLVKSKQKALERWIEKQAPSFSCNVEVYTGIRFLEIIKSVLINQFDLVIKCADDADWLDRLCGTDDMNLLRKCPCPVLILKPGQNDVFRNLLATVDIAEDCDEQDENRVQNQLNKEVLEYSSLLAVSQLTQLHIGSVWDAHGEDFLRYSAFSSLPSEKVDEHVKQVQREYSDKLDLLVRGMSTIVGKDAVDYLRPQSHLVKGFPSKEIPLMVDKYSIDLIVMGTVARTGIPGFLIGNTAESILEQVKCSVLAIKPTGFVTPVKL